LYREFSGDEVEHYDSVFMQSVYSGFSSHRRQDTVEAFHTGAGDPERGEAKDAIKVVEDAVCCCWVAPPTLKH
jgi:hypothetical protein